jgi:hypothetical protein
MTQFYVIFLSACLVTLSGFTPRSEANQSGVYLASADVRQKALSYSKAFQDLAAKVEPRFYSVDGLIDALDYDVEAAVNFVENEIAYDPYLGVMRGPDGTISAEAGSSWDQAVLLAALINAMGGEAMLALGKLPSEESIDLLARGIVNRQLPIDRLGNLDTESFLKERLGIKTTSSSSLENTQSSGVSYEEYSNAANKISSRLITQMKAEGHELSKADASAAMDYAEQLGSEYVWVRYRDTPNDQWAEVHPVYAGETPPKVEPEQYVSAKVPEKKLHKIAVQFHIETQVGDSFKRTAVSQIFQKPAANLAATQLSIGIAPNTVGLDDEPSFYTPIIGDAPAPGAKSFTMMGQTLSPEDAAAGPAIFATVGNKLGGALEGISGNEKDVPKLTGVFLTISHIAPGGERFDEERRLTDFREGRPLNYHLEMISRMVVEVDVGPENSARNYRDFLQSGSINIRQLPYVRAVIEGDLPLEDMFSHPAFIEKSTHGWLQALAIENLISPRSEAGRVIRTSPLVMLKRDVLGADRTLVFAVDIQHNRVRGFSIDQNSQPVENLAIALRQGVMETLLEGELIGVSRIRDWKMEDKMRLISSVKELEKDPIWSAVRPLTQDRLVADLKQSGQILIPNNQKNNWWRVDNKTGNVLGMGAIGGSEVGEKTVLDAFTEGFSVGFFAYGTVGGSRDCLSSGKSAGYKACCVAGVLAVNGVVGAYGGVTSELIGGFHAGMGALFSLSFDVVTGHPSSPAANTLGGLSDSYCGWAVGE